MKPTLEYEEKNNEEQIKNITSRNNIKKLQKRNKYNKNQIIELPENKENYNIIYEEENNDKLTRNDILITKRYEGRRYDI